MIGFFTDPFPDELLYSACSRYYRRAGNLSKAATARDLFGSEQAKIIVDLPNRIGHLAAQLPPETYSVTRLIDDNTMLPYYAAFMPVERFEQLRTDMQGDGGSVIHGRIGILTSAIREEVLRYCPVCAEDDRTNYGQPYWRRLHQAPGVDVCPTHAVFLERTHIQTRDRGSHEALVTAKQVLRELPSPRELNLKNKDHQIYQRIAQESMWLLNERIGGTNLDTLRRRYLRLLHERGMASYAGTVRSPRLQAKFQEYYSPELLSRLNCSLEARYNWLARLVQNSRGAHHPLHHLLLMQFLECSAEQFFKLPIEIEPFGKGPWPCLNLVSKHYRENLIPGYKIGHTKEASKRLMGTFRCDCGFTYSRNGPDTTEEARYSYSRVMSFGEVWEASLREMYRSGRYTRADMARQLGVSLSTLDTQTTQLDLKGPTQEKDKGKLLVSIKSDNRRSDASVKRVTYREQWRQAVADNPSLSREAVREKIPAAYNWLIREDKDWFCANSPARLKPPGPPPNIDWEKRDAELATAVRKRAEELLAAPVRPMRVSKTGVARNLGILAIVDKRADKVPLAIQALDECAESIEACAARRVRWAAQCFRQEHVRAGYWQILMRAGMSYKVAAVPEVKAAFDEAIAMLSKLNEQGWEEAGVTSV